MTAKPPSNASIDRSVHEPFRRAAAHAPSAAGSERLPGQSRPTPRPRNSTVQATANRRAHRSTRRQIVGTPPISPSFTSVQTDGRSFAIGAMIASPSVALCSVKPMISNVPNAASPSANAAPIARPFAEVVQADADRDQQRQHPAGRPRRSPRRSRTTPRQPAAEQSRARRRRPPPTHSEQRDALKRSGEQARSTPALRSRRRRAGTAAGRS